MTKPQADSRPRIHIWQQSSGVLWSIGPTGKMSYADTPGGAVDAALVQITPQPAVIIFEGAGR